MVRETAVNQVALMIVDKRVYLVDQVPPEVAGLVEVVLTGFVYFGFAGGDGKPASEELTIVATKLS